MKLTPILRMKVLCLYEELCSYRAVAKQFNRTTSGFSITHAGVRNIVLAHSSSPTHTCRSAERSGRPRCTSTNTDRLLCRRSLENRFKTAPVLRAEISDLCEVSDSTVRRRLCEKGFTIFFLAFFSKHNTVLKQVFLVELPEKSLSYLRDTARQGYVLQKSTFLGPQSNGRRFCGRMSRSSTCTGATADGCLCVAARARALTVSVCRPLSSMGEEG